MSSFVIQFISDFNCEERYFIFVYFTINVLTSETKQTAEKKQYSSELKPHVIKNITSQN